MYVIDRVMLWKELLFIRVLERGLEVTIWIVHVKSCAFA